MPIRYFKYDLILKTPFRLSYGTYHTRKTFILELTVDGYSGYGEVVCIDYYGWNPERVERQLLLLAELIQERSFSDYSEIRNFINDRRDILAPVRSAFDC